MSASLSMRGCSIASPRYSPPTRSARRAAGGCGGHRFRPTATSCSGQLSLASLAGSSPSVARAARHGGDTPTDDDDALLDRARYGHIHQARLQAGDGHGPFAVTSRGAGAVTSAPRRWPRRRADSRRAPGARRCPRHAAPWPIDMHEGMVHSCNAYSRSSREVGPGDAARHRGAPGISTSRRTQRRPTSGDVAPSGYGQADVLASPLRMARVAAPSRLTGCEGRARPARHIGVSRRDASAARRGQTSRTIHA